MSALLGFAHQVLELGEDLLDRIEVGAVRRQEQEMGTGVADRGAGGLALVRAQIVENDEAASRLPFGPQPRSGAILVFTHVSSRKTSRRGSTRC